MEDIKIKLREIYLPFLIVSISTILLYNLFRWTLDIQLGILPLKKDLLNFWIPFTLPIIPVLIWLRRRVRFLKVRGKNDNGYFLYQMAMAGAIAAPLVVSQHYLEKASFGLVEVQGIQEIEHHQDEKYFHVQSFSVDSRTSLPYITARTSGKNNENLKFYLYLSSHFEGSENVWYGVEYKENLSNRINDERKDAAYRSFIEKLERAFASYNFQNAAYFEKLGYSDEMDGFMEAIKRANINTNPKEQIVLVPKTDAFELRLGTTFPWIFGSFGIGAFVLLLMVVFPKVDQVELGDFRKDKPLKEDDLRDVLEFFNPRGTNKATAILLLSNVAVFVAMTLYGLNIISPTPQELLEIGGNRRPEVLNGEYWRLFTSIFIHSGIMHLFMNLFGLGIGANLLEGVLGKVKLIASFIVCGIAGSLASIYWHDNTVSVGASGAIFGLYGLILAFTVFKIYPSHMRGMTWVLLALYAGGSLLFGLFGGIDNAAHVGGLISGFAIGGILIVSQKEKLLKNADQS